MFVSLYELWLGQNNNPTYANEVFTPVGLITLFVTLVLAAIYYIGLGRWRAIFHRTPQWVLTLVIAASFAFAYALFYAKDRTQAEETDGYMTGFGAVNAMYALIYFLVFSLLLKGFSIFAKRTPF